MFTSDLLAFVCLLFILFRLPFHDPFISQLILTLKKKIPFLPLFIFSPTLQGSKQNNQVRLAEFALAVVIISKQCFPFSIPFISIPLSISLVRRLPFQIGLIAEVLENSWTSYAHGWIT
ncbi:hypothetical protein GQ457_07G020350 [Hibiscus cannabinus]